LWIIGEFSKQTPERKKARYVKAQPTVVFEAKKNLFTLPLLLISKEEPVRTRAISLTQECF